MSSKIKSAIENFNAWMDESLDNRCCLVLACIATGFWLHLIRINLAF